MIQIDTREQNNTHILKTFDKMGIEYFDEPFDFGDYGNVFSKDKVRVERKKNLIEFAGNIGKNHARFKAELEKAKEQGYKVYILIEQEMNYEDLKYWINPRAKIKYRTLKNGTIKEIKSITGEQIWKVCENWKEKYNIEFVFVAKKFSAMKILELLEYDLKSLGV